MLVPDQDVGQDGDELADVADDGDGRRRHRLPQLPGEVVHGEAHRAADAQRPQPGHRQLRSRGDQVTSTVRTELQSLGRWVQRMTSIAGHAAGMEAEVQGSLE